ncbi:MAG: tetratricopeptide repeat protein, partial [Candidatus Omnitrophica bacterium]|nr:tetratricopeptide repeat protein [Candidatus Omnitrophota bacterium]
MSYEAGLQHYIDIGCCHRDLKHYDKAIEEFNRVLKINPEHLEAYYHLGLCYHQQKDMSSALTYFNKALKLSPNEERIHESLGFCYLDLKKVHRAIEEFRQILAINPNSQYGHLGLGFCYLEQRQTERVLDEFNQVLKLNVQNDQAHLGLGLHYKFNKQFDKAIDELKQALKINTKIEVAHQNLGEIYLERKMYNLAQIEFEQTLQLNTDNISARQMLGYVYKRQSKDYLAVTEFIRATNLYLAKEKANKVVDDNGGELAVKMLRMPSFCNKDEINSTGLNTSLLPPLALGQIVAYLRAKGIKIDQDDLNINVHYDNCCSKILESQVDVSVFFDENKISKYISGAEDKYIDMIMEKIERKSEFCGYNVILLSLPVMTSNSSGLLFTLGLCRFLKKKYNPIVIAGGARQSIDLLNKYECKDIDFVSNGGESMLFRLLSEFKNGLELTESLDGSRIRENGCKLIAGEPTPMLKPDFSGLPIDKYKYKGLRTRYSDECREILEEFNKSGTLLLPFKFITGCPYECAFCPMAVNKSMHVLDPATVALYLKELQEEYNPTGFFFLSDTINISRQYVNELCDEIIKNKAKILWSDCARADNLDRDTLFKMREAGCIRLIFGIETASPRLLQYIRKGIGVKRLEDTLRWSDEAGIWTGVEIICGLPHEKDSDVEETVAFLNKNKKY